VNIEEGIRLKKAMIRRVLDLTNCPQAFRGHHNGTPHSRCVRQFSKLDLYQIEFAWSRADIMKLWAFAEGGAI
jgi:hypothetical protein